MKRTKFFEIFISVFNPYFHCNLMQDIGNGNYSLFLDVSNDITVIEIVGIAAIYFDKKQKKSLFLHFFISLR